MPLIPLCFQAVPEDAEYPGTVLSVSATDCSAACPVAYSAACPDVAVASAADYSVASYCSYHPDMVAAVVLYSCPAAVAASAASAAGCSVAYHSSAFDDSVAYLFPDHPVSANMYNSMSTCSSLTVLH